ncbi:class I SAM-dependent methyltransferase [bacterium]|nr:class I SAM-dependent methyltransferase [bacterium]
MDADQGPSVRKHARGIRRLDPLPTSDELDEFYANVYHTANAGKAPDVARLRTESEAASAERAWRAETIYSDVLHYLSTFSDAGGRVIDVGCGTGEFVDYMSAQPGWEAAGVELAPDAVALARERGSNVRGGTIDDVETEFGTGFSALTMFNVLEHLLDPWATLSTASRLLRPGGVIVVQVPNDFSRLQNTICDHLGTAPWWIAVPDHVNYFDFDSLETTLCDAGFVPQIRHGSFPMEFFLLGGHNYVEDPSQGSAAHRARCGFELSMPGEVRRALFKDFARAGIGRNALVVAQKAEASD